MTNTRILSYQLADYLEELGVKVVFGLCGHTNIAFIDALHKSNIRFIITRHEQIAAHMADGYARATGKPGVMLSHFEVDPNELGRNFPTHIGAISDAKSALSAILAAAKEICPEGIHREGLRQTIRAGIDGFAQQWAHQRVSDQFPLRPERILADVRQTLPEDGLIVMDVGWNKNGVGSSLILLCLVRLSRRVPLPRWVLARSSVRSEGRCTG